MGFQKLTAFRVKGLFLRPPEGVILRERQRGEGLHRPVGGAGGVVALAHDEVWVAVADGEHPVPGEDRPPEPFPHVGKQNVFHDAVVHALGFLPVQRQHGKERALGKAVGEAAPVRQRVALPVKPQRKPRREEARALPEQVAARRVQFFHGAGVYQSVVMERPESIVLPLIGVIVVPTVALVMGLDQLQVRLHAFGVIGKTVQKEADVDQHPEEEPVVLGHVIPVDLGKPGVDVFLHSRREIKEEPLRDHAHRHAHHGHLHQPLIVITHLAPVFRVIRVRAVFQTLPPQRPQRLRGAATAREHRHDCPERPGIGLHLRDLRWIHRARLPQMEPRPAGA